MASNGLDAGMPTKAAEDAEAHPSAVELSFKQPKGERDRPTMSGGLGEVAQAVEMAEGAYGAGDDADSTAGDPTHEHQDDRNTSGSRKGGRSIGDRFGFFHVGPFKRREAKGEDGGALENDASVVRRSWKARIPERLKRSMTFYRIHFTVLFILMMIGTLIIYFSPNGKDGPLPFIDSMYVATSALCVTGLISVSMADLSTFDKTVLMFLMVLGSQVFTSLVPVFVRRYYFKKFLEKEGIQDEDSLAGSARRDLAQEDGEQVPGGQATQEDNQNLMAEVRSFSFSASADMGNRLGTADVTDVVTSPVSGNSNEIEERRRSGTPTPTRIIGGQRVAPSSEGPFPLSGELRQSSDNGPITTAGARTGAGPNGEARPSTATGVPAVARGRLLDPLDGADTSLGRILDDGDEAGRAATSTWAGDTAQLNAKRLQRILEAARQHDRTSAGADATTPLLRSLTSKLQAKGGMQRSSTLFTRPTENLTVDASKLRPAERRFCELRALEMLSWLVPLYMASWIVLSFLLLFICLRVNPYYMGLLYENYDTSPVFMAVFQSVSAFANAGLSLFDDNLISFQAYLPYLAIVMVLILVGNTLYAPTLRFLLIIISRHGTEQQRFVAQYLLDHPRRCYTHLFPASDTLWLVFTVVMFNTTEAFFFWVLDWNSPALDGLPTDIKILDGIFQSISTRNAGFNVIALGLLSAAMLVLYAGMMYVAVYPVYITRQRSREQREVYDDEDLQIFYEDLEEGVMNRGVLAQGKKMLSRDSALLFISVFLICIIQRSEIENDPANYSVFNIIFEVISAYGNVGLSLGYTCQSYSPNCVNVPYSFSGVWKTGTKLIIILVMFLGRHRGLPDNIDAAITIPDRKRFRNTFPRTQSGEKETLIRIESVLSQPPRSSTPQFLRSRSVFAQHTTASTATPVMRRAVSVPKSPKEVGAPATLAGDKLSLA